MIGGLLKGWGESFFGVRDSRIKGSESKNNVGDLELKKWAQDFVSYLEYLENTSGSNKPSVLIRATKKPDFPIFMKKEYYGQEDNATRILEGFKRMVSIDDNLSLELDNIPEGFDVNGFRNLFRKIFEKLLYNKHKNKIERTKNYTSGQLENLIERE